MINFTHCVKIIKTLTGVLEKSNKNRNKTVIQIYIYWYDLIRTEQQTPKKHKWTITKSCPSRVITDLSLGKQAMSLIQRYRKRGDIERVSFASLKMYLLKWVLSGLSFYK